MAHPLSFASLDSDDALRCFGPGPHTTFRKTMLTLRSPMLCAAVAALLAIAPANVTRAQQSEDITVDARASTTPFPHFWEEMFGSGRAALVLRTAYQNDLTAVKAITDVKYLRFHAILHDALWGRVDGRFFARELEGGMREI